MKKKKPRDVNLDDVETAFNNYMGLVMMDRYYPKSEYELTIEKLLNKLDGEEEINEEDMQL